MTILIALIKNPEFILPFLRVHADTTLGLLVWYLDMLTSFLIIFATAHTLFSTAERLLPRPPGARPNTWRTPLIFAAAAIAFHSGADRVVSDTLRNLLDSLSLIPGQTLTRALGCAWLLGAAINLWRTLLGRRGIIRTSRAAARLPLCEDKATRAILHRAQTDAKIKRTVALRTGAKKNPIFSCGIWSAHIVVPMDFTARHTPEEQYAILLHECTHIRRRDSLTLPCMAVAGAVLWFDPVVRRALRRMKTDMELFCDWAAVRVHGVPPELYAGLILSTAAGTNPTGNEPFAATFSKEYRAVAERLGHVLQDENLLAPSRPTRKRAAISLAALGAALIAATIYYAGLPPTPATPPDSIRGSNGELLGYEERNGVFGAYGFAYTMREK